MCGWLLGLVRVSPDLTDGRQAGPLLQLLMGVSPSQHPPQVPLSVPKPREQGVTLACQCPGRAAFHGSGGGSRHALSTWRFTGLLILMVSVGLVSSPIFPGCCL